MQADLFGAVDEAPVVPEVRVPVAAAKLPVPDVALVREVEDAPVMAAQRHVWSVRSLVSAIRQQVEKSHFSVWVEGEISNCRPAASGHIYFTLKDGEAQLPVVLFRRQAQLLSVRPKDGDAVEVRGRISIYESRGQLQLIAETLELRGAGALELAFKQLKARLLAEGLFDEDRKRALPAFPRCVGVVTSPSGAVIRDIVHVVRRRHARLNVLVYPAAMQGAACAGSVSAGIRWFNRHPGLVDVIVLARGGGSIEDLSGFNDEGLARVIAASELPVVSAIGHETDFTIADFVADLRAPTPSAAAEMVTAAQHRIEERVWSLEQRVHRAGRYQVMLARQRYTRLSAESVLVRLRDAVSRRDQRLDELRLRLDSGVLRRLRVPGQRLAVLAERLRRQDPTQRLVVAQRRLQRAVEAMDRLRVSVIAARTARLERASTRLHALSPLAVLNRGYALVYGEDGVLLRDVGAAKAGQQIRARLAKGSLIATVKETTE
ncbi:exodeoxyribonuclease VII large subunit [Granulicella arctica]|uniref:Exodeoxyribonuclease 7 large subunit n=1 Tax=Granulicella arctica TaxID=940613 RepID=A0A7Y9TEN6_9BACT|nr:exodeoxyribonuclease VII large subunit [Granulicella arctica]